MNLGKGPPVILRLADQPPDDLDRTLRAFFRAEMPDPWPKMSAPRPDQQPAARPAPGPWPLLRRRFALAAAVAFLLLGSLAMTRSFPGDPGAASVHPDRDRHIGSRFAPGVAPRQKSSQAPAHTVPTRNGGEAQLWEERLPGGGLRLQIQEIRQPLRNP